MSDKKGIILLITTLTILTTIAIFSILNWDVITYLFKEMNNGVEILKDYVLSYGVKGYISISLIIIFCFFFPFISSVPIQVASAVCYGGFGGVVHVAISVFIASQLAFLFTRNSKLFLSKKKLEEKRLIEEKIRNSKRSILEFLILAYLAPFVPFLLIHMVAAQSGLKWWKYSIITLLGPLPDIIITVWAGVKITTSQSPIVSYIILMVIITCVVLSLIYKNKIIDAVFSQKKEK